MVLAIITCRVHIVTLPFGEPWVLKIKNKSDALKRSITWTVVLTLNYLVISIGNQNYKIIFGNVGIYVLLSKGHFVTDYR